MKYSIITLLLCLGIAGVFAQGLDSVFVEVFYDASQTNRYQDTLPAGAKTYRIFVDMKEGYHLQAVYGDEYNPLEISTTTTFYNNTDFGSTVPYSIRRQNKNKGTTVFDSWITIGTALSSFVGIPLDEDDPEEASQIRNPYFTEVDGFTIGNINKVYVFGLDLTLFRKDTTLNTLYSDNGGWGIAGNGKGPTSANRVLIAQLTTDGEISFRINLQIKRDDGWVEKHVHSHVEYDEYQSNYLIFPSPKEGKL